MRISTIRIATIIAVELTPEPKQKQIGRIFKLVLKFSILFLSNTLIIIECLKESFSMKRSLQIIFGSQTENLFFCGRWTFIKVGISMTPLTRAFTLRLRR